MSLPPGTFPWLSGVGLSNVMLPNNPESVVVAVWLYGNLCKAQYLVCAGANGRLPPLQSLMGDPNR